MGGWSCPYQTKDMQCQRVKIDCKPGMKGCVLRGKVVFAQDDPPLDPPKKSSKPRKTKRKPSK
jgi:hypothetical protein